MGPGRHPHDLVVPLMMAIVFWPAGTLAYWEGWVYLAVLYLPALLIVPALMARIVGEEAVLRRELSGYSHYTEQVRYRFIPGVW